jgi:hypothetical protein
MGFLAARFTYHASPHPAQRLSAAPGQASAIKLRPNSGCYLERRGSNAQRGGGGQKIGLYRAMALSASRTTIDVTNTATKTIAPQNDFLPNVSIRPSTKNYSLWNIRCAKTAFCSAYPLIFRPEFPNLNLESACPGGATSLTGVRRPRPLRSLLSV